MPPPGPRLIRISHEADVILARRAAIMMGGDVGFDSRRSHALATAVSELASNLLVHARNGGTVSLSAMMEDGRPGVEILCVDDGPGIADLDLALSDGYSSVGGLGGGLPGVGRLADDFEISSAIGERAFTRIRARLWLPIS